MNASSPHVPVHDFSPEDDLGLSALRFAELGVPNGYDFSVPHRHSYYEVFFFHKGGGTHLIDFIEHRILDNSVHFVTPGQIHMLGRVPESYGVLICFSKEALLQFQGTYSLLQNAPSTRLHEERSYSTIAALLGLLRADIESSVKHHQVALASLNIILLKSILPLESVPLERNISSHFARFKAMVEVHYRSGKQPGWYAGQLDITEKHLNGCCKADTGITVSQYLKERILLEAKRLLCHSKGSIKEIGYHLGFDDPAYFTRFFRKNAGVNALDFRKRFE